jgi:hypothetical protein
LKWTYAYFVFDNRSVSWYKSTRGIIVAAGIVLAVCMGIILPTVLAVVLTRNPLSK